MATMQKELTGVIALVTGSTSGIGKATATALAQLGATVIVTGRNVERGEAVVEADRVLDLSTVSRGITRSVTRQRLA